MRSRPITEAIVAASRQDWPEATYDVATFALTAIDLVIAQQGFDEEATHENVVGGLTTLARRAAPGGPPSEHRRVAEFTMDALLNRGEREAPFTYRISDFTAEAGTHQQRQVQFRLLIEREDPVRVTSCSTPPGTRSTRWWAAWSSTSKTSRSPAVRGSPNGRPVGNCAG
jgi:hypothetical protein